MPELRRARRGAHGLLRLRRLLHGDDRGGVAVLLGILMGGGVLLGMLALVVDVGQVQAERRQQQNGADAAAFAVVKTCRAGSCDLSTQQTGTAAQAAGADANDNVTGVTSVCGRGINLNACPAGAGDLADCLSLPSTLPNTAPYVEVRTHTQNADGSTLLPPTFARTLLGESNYKGTPVGACARVAWGPPSSYTGLAVTFSACEWAVDTNKGADYAPLPDTLSPYPWAAGNPPGALKSYEKTITLHTSPSSSANPCPQGPSGWDQPGAFGWLQSDGNCNTQIVGGVGVTDPGNSAPQGCKNALSTYWTDGYNGTPDILVLPVYTVSQGPGANTTYQENQAAAFVLTGYNIPSASKASWLSGTLCPGTCLMGFFVNKTVTVGEIGTGMDTGVDVVKLVG